MYPSILDLAILEILDVLFSVAMEGILNNNRLKVSEKKSKYNFSAQKPDQDPG